MSVRPDRIERLRDALDRRLGSVVTIAEAVRRRHNASAILRSCECFGVHEVHLVTGPFRPSKGATRGAERWLEIQRHRTVTPCIEGLKARGFRVYVADLTDDAHTPETLPVDQPVAVLFGSEFTGVTDEARAAADGAVCVPMRGLTESLNVSVAAACLLQRVTERRRQAIGRAGDLEQARKDTALAEWLEREEFARLGMAARTR